MSRPTLEVELAGPGSLIRGYGARELYEEIVGRAPVWVSRLRGWSCQEVTAQKVVSLAEGRGYDIVITGRRTRRQQVLDSLLAAPLPRPLVAPADLGADDTVVEPRRTEQADPGQGLW